MTDQIINAVKDMKDGLTADFKSHMSATEKAQNELKEKLAHAETKAQEDRADIEGRLKDSQEELSKMGDELKRLHLKSRSIEGKGLSYAMEDHKDFLGELKNGRKIELKDISSITYGAGVTLGLGSGSFAQIPTPELKLTLLDFLPQIQAMGESFAYMREKGFVNNAAVVKAGTVKPVSSIELEAKIGYVKTFAHLFNVENQALEDIKGLEQHINARGVYMLRQKIETGVLDGDGTELQLAGIKVNSTAYDKATIGGTTLNLMDDVINATAQIALTGLSADVIIANPVDMAKAKKLRDANGLYLHPAFGNGSIFGVPVVESASMPAGKFLVMASRGNVALRTRNALEIARSTEHADNFAHNMTTIRVEQRVGLEVLYPSAVLYGSITV